MHPTALATLNACLNALSFAFLVTGFYFIRKKQIAKHRFCMLTAFGISCAFLVSYLVHHARVGSVEYAGPESLRNFYRAVLFPHIVLAATVPVLAIVTIRRALKGNFERHRAIARVTLPIWLYVSVSGVVVYWMLYRM